MNNQFQLDVGAIRKIYQNETSQKPIVQLADIRKIVTSNAGERYRLIVSDGNEYIQGMLATQIAHMVTNSHIKKYSVVRLTEYICNTVNGKRICIIIKLEVIGHATATIGHPQLIQPNSTNVMVNQQKPSGPAPIPQQIMHTNQSQFNYQQQSLQNNQGNRNYNNNNNNSNISNSIDNEQYQPISSLNPYQSNWRIKVRCTGKDPVRDYKNYKGEGKVFSCDLLDKDGGEIRATMFNEAVDKFYPIFERNKVYLISRGQVKVARKQFSHIKNDYSITLGNDAEVIPIQDEGKIDKQKYKFVSLGSLQQIEPNSYVDVIGIVASVGAAAPIMSNKIQKSLNKRTIILVDQTARVEVTLWNQHAVDFNEEKLGNNAVIAIKGAKVSDFGNRSLSVTGAIEVWPDRVEATRLREWYNTHGIEGISQMPLLTVPGFNGSQPTERKTFIEVKDQNLGTSNEKGDFFEVLGTITSISHSQDRPPWYKACPDKELLAKVMEDGRGQWYCAKNNTTYPNYKPVYILRFCVNDFSGQQWMSAFNLHAQKILLDTPASEVEQLLNNGDIAGFESKFQDACFKRYIFKVRAKSEAYQDERRTRYDIINIQDVDFVHESRDLIEKIKSLEQQRIQNAY